ncbi:MAG: hypothetical protein ACT4TC_16325 [Myxococcaceae bacterium]
MSEALARQIRTELSDVEPQGFHFNDSAVRQDAALERMVEQLKAHDDAQELERALSLALLEEKEGWTQLKLLEVTDRLRLVGTAEALMSLAADPPDEGPRRDFLAGRACEVLLRLPLNLEQRARANELSKGRMEDMQRFRLGAQRVRNLHRPRLAEWSLLVVLMLVSLSGLVFALL